MSPLPYFCAQDGEVLRKEWVLDHFKDDFEIFGLAYPDSGYN